MRIVLADDHALVRSALRALLQAHPGAEVAGEARTGQEMLDLVAALDPDLVLCDIAMPGMDGIEALRELRRRASRAHALVVSMNDTPSVVRAAIAAGSKGFLLKSASVQELGQAIRTVMEGKLYVSPAVAIALVRQEPDAPEQLTARQVQVLRGLALGHGSRRIGQDLGLSSKTVDVHRARIMERLRLHDVAGLTRYALRHGIVDADAAC